MIGNLYFVVKAAVITFVIVCLLQIQFRNRTLEDRLMALVRTSLAPQVLGRENSTVLESTYKLSPSELVELRQKVFNSEALKGVKKNVKSLFFQEMTDVMEKSKKEQKKEQ